MTVSRAKRRTVTPEAFRRSRIRAGLNVERCAAMLHVDPRTVRNWEAGRTAVPWSAMRVLRLETGLRLPGNGWRGWSICGDALVSPAGARYCAKDLGWLSLTFRRADAFDAIFAAYRKLLEPCEGLVPKGSPAARSLLRSVKAA